MNPFAPLLAQFLASNGYDAYAACGRPFSIDWKRSAPKQPACALPATPAYAPTVRFVCRPISLDVYSPAIEMSSIGDMRESFIMPLRKTGRAVLPMSDYSRVRTVRESNKLIHFQFHMSRTQRVVLDFVGYITGVKLTSDALEVNFEG